MDDASGFVICSLLTRIAACLSRPGLCTLHDRSFDISISFVLSRRDNVLDPFQLESGIA